MRASGQIARNQNRRTEFADRAGKTSPWTAQRCTARPLDDRALTTSTGWVRVKSSRFWNATATDGKARSARVTRTSAHADRIALVATKCPACGLVAIYVGSTRVAKVSLASAKTHYRSVVLLPRFTYRAATITLKVLSSGRLVQIDGLGISRS